MADLSVQDVAFDYDQLDPGIRGVVERLHRLGYETTDSGDGVAKMPMPCALPFRHVVVKSPFGAEVIEDLAHDIKSSVEYYAYSVEGKEETWDTELSYSTRDSQWYVIVRERTDE